MENPQESQSTPRPNTCGHDGPAPCGRVGPSPCQPGGLDYIEDDFGGADTPDIPNFHAEWDDHIHRIKVHELLRVMEEEQKKFKALQSESDLNDFISGYKDDDNLTDEEKAKMLYMKSLGEEQAEIDELATLSRYDTNDPDFVSKSAVKLFRNNVEISDEQFELILSLCRDKVEQKQLRDAFMEIKLRDKYLRNAGEQRKMLYNFLNSTFFNYMMLFLIFLSTIILILLTFESIEVRFDYSLLLLDAFIMCFFILEAVAKIIIYKEEYFRNVWNIIDLVIIITYFVEIAVDLVTRIFAVRRYASNAAVFKFFKSLRALRLLRAIRFLPTLHVIVSTIFKSLVSLGSITVLMILFIFLFAIIGRGFFNEQDPIHFGSIWKAILTLFQLLTLDDWFDILDASSEEGFQYWTLFFYLFSYIVLEYFVFLNLFVAVLVDNFQLALKDSSIGEFKQRLDFRQPKSLGLDINEDEEEFDIYIDPNVEKAKDKESPDLDVEDYLPLNKNSEEAKLMSENLKLLNSLDFEHFIFVRRMKLLSTVMEKATFGRQHTWFVHDDIPDLGPDDDRHTYYLNKNEVDETVDVAPK